MRHDRSQYDSSYLIGSTGMVNGIKSYGLATSKEGELVASLSFFVLILA
jgi:hypothetical protein